MRERRYKCSKWKRWLVNQQIQQIQHIEDDITKLNRTYLRKGTRARKHTPRPPTHALQTFEGGEQ